MKDKAIAKITQEAMAINDPIAFAIEEHLTEKVTSDAAALLILAEDKSLKKIYDNIWAEAKKRRKGNCAFIPPEEVYDIIDKYYGLEQLGAKASKRESANRVDILDLI